MALRASPALRPLETIRPWSVLAPILAGAVIASGMTVVLMEASLIWPLLAIAGVLACLPALVLKEPQLYWLSVFLFSSALDIKKNLVDGLMIRAAFKMDYELPILVPEIRLSDLAFLMLLGLWLLRILGRREEFRFPPVAWLAVAYLGWAALSLLGAPNLYFGAVQLTREIKFFVVFLYVVNNIDSKRIVRVIAGALLAVLVLQAGLTLARYQFQFGYLGGDMFGRVVVDVAKDPLLTVTDVGGKLGGGRRAFGTMGSPAGTAEHLLLLLPVALFAGFGASTSSRRVALFALCALGTAALVVTFSRTALNGFIVGLVLTAVLVHRRQLIPRRTLGLALLLVSVSALWISPLVYSYYATRPSPVTIRFVQYWTALNMIRANPILGVGLNNSAGLQRNYNSDLSTVPLNDPTKAAYKAPIHNYFLSMTADIGIIGTALFVTFFILICREGYRWTHSRDREVCLAACAALVAIVSLWAAVLADPLYQDGTQTLLWFFSGLTLAFGRIAGESPASAVRRRFA